MTPSSSVINRMTKSFKPFCGSPWSKKSIIWQKTRLQIHCFLQEICKCCIFCNAGSMWIGGRELEQCLILIVSSFLHDDLVSITVFTLWRNLNILSRKGVSCKHHEFPLKHFELSVLDKILFTGHNFWNLWNLLKQVAQRATIAHLSPVCQGQISFQTS